MTAPKATFAVIGVVFLLDLLVMYLLLAVGAPEDAPTAALTHAGLLAALLVLPVYVLQRRLRGANGHRGVERGAGSGTSTLTITDSLTGVMNRRGITASLLDAMAQAERYNTPLAVALGDLDNLKRITETRGASAVDKALAHAASALAETLRMPDKVGRYSNEEFLIVFPHTTLAQARKISERMRNAVQKSKLKVDGTELALTVSLGVTQFQKGEDLEHLLSRAERALTQAKSGGRNFIAAQKAARAARE
ncbi:MAG: GGDEF domain-containing protein [Sulfurifustis sp.]